MLETEKIPKYTDASFLIEIDYFLWYKKKGQKKKNQQKQKTTSTATTP